MWNLKPADRLHEWKEFRQTISNLSFEEAILKTVNLWSYAPFVDHYLDKCSHTEWPDPWELLQDNKYDDLSKALGMLNTLFLSEHGKDHTFQIIKAYRSSQLESYNIVSIDEGKYILNYIFNEITSQESMDPNISITETFSTDDLQLTKY